MLPSPHDPDFPAALTAVRLQHRMNLSEVAREVGVAASIPGRWEAGKTPPSGKNWLALTKLFYPEKTQEPDMALHTMPLDLLVNEMHRRGYAVTLTPLK